MITYSEVTIYTATDGTEFRDYDDCLNYELTTHPIKFKMWNYYMRPLNGTEARDFEAVYFVRLNTDDEIVEFTDMARAQGILVDGIDGAGFYRWDDVNEHWVNMEDEHQNLVERIGEIEDQIDIMKGEGEK